MKSMGWGLVLLLGACPAGAQGPKKAEPIQVPYRLTNTQHILVRAKIDGKGPFNFIIDTGAPIMFVSSAVGKQLGLKPDKNLFVKLDRLEIEGGVVLRKFPCRVDTPFQLEGMNGMGLAGRELHGIIGYTLLAKFRMEIDLTRDKMVWTPLAYKVPPPKGFAGKGGGSQAGLEMLGTVMKFMGFLVRAKLNPETATHGFVGIELRTGKETVTIARVLGKSPAAAAGLQAGDRIDEINGQTVVGMDDVRRITAQNTAGQPLQILIIRGKQKLKIRVSTGEGL